MNSLTIEKYCELIQEHIVVCKMNHKKFDVGKLMFWSQQIHDYCAQALYLNSNKKEQN